MRFRNGLLKAVTLSYDDGPMSDEKCIDIMAKNGLKGTFNINSSMFWSENESSKAEAEHLKNIYKSSGNEVACHGVQHLKLTEMDRKGKVKEVLEDRIRLETEFNSIVRGMAYAYGLYNDDTVNVLKECGIVTQEL